MAENATEDVEHGDFGTSDEVEEEVVHAGSSDVEMNLVEEDGVPEEQDVDPDVREKLDEAVEEGVGTEYENHREAVNAATGRNNNPEEDESLADQFQMDPEEVQNDEEVESNTDSDDTDLPESTAEEVGMQDGEMDFSALKSTEQVTETVTRGNQEFEFVFEEPEGSDDEIINMVRARQNQDPENIDESEVEAELRREAVMKTLVSPSSDVVEDQWDEFAGSVKLQLGGRALQVLGLMDFIRASGAGPELQQGG